jgi:hypothetical protein
MDDFIVNNENVAKGKVQDFVLRQALANDELPEFLNLDLEWDPKKKLESRVYSPAKMQERGHNVDSPFRNHTGLYDGTGYGGSSSSASRPATAVVELTTPMTTPGADIPGCYPNDEAERPKVEEKL